MRVQVSPLVFCGCSSIGRVSPFQGECCGFDSRRPLCSRRITEITPAYEAGHRGSNPRENILRTSYKGSTAVSKTACGGSNPSVLV